MIKKSTGINKRYFRSSDNYYNKQLNRVMLVLFILLIVLIIKMLNNKTANNVIQIIEKNIYYDFSLKEDGKKAKNYIIKAFDHSKDTIERIALDITKRYR